MFGKSTKFGQIEIKIGKLYFGKTLTRTRWHKFCKTQIPAQTWIPKFKLAHLCTENYDFDRKNDKNDDFDDFFLKTMILTKKC